MKRFIFFFFTLANLSLVTAAHADDVAKIRINISGAGSLNRYFLCLPGVGCLSIKAAANGRVFSIIHSFDMDNMYLLDRAQGYKFKSQGLPASCNRTVNTNQTITISGSLASGTTIKINGLHCSVS